MLDVTDIGRNLVHVEGTARTADDQPPASEHPAYLAKYTERIAALFGRSCYMLTMTWTSAGPGGYWVSDDKALLDTERVHGWMSRESYWAAGRAREVTERSIAQSLCVGLYPPDGGGQAGFARAVSDYATFCWLCDVFVDTAHRGSGVGSFLVQAALGHPQVAGLRTVLMAAPERSLYRRLGFAELIRPERWMERPSSSG